MNKSVRQAAVAATLALGAAGAVQAGGFMLFEQSVAGLGRAYAGAGLQGDDLSATFYNPAGITMLKGDQFQFGGVFAGMDLPVTTTEGEKDNGRKHAVPIPNMYFTHQINDEWYAALGITVPFGMATEYGRGWGANDRGMNAEIKVFDINPNIAYKVNDKISVGLGFSAQYALAHFESAVKASQVSTAAAAAGSYVDGKYIYGRLAADSWALGYNLGMTWQPTDDLKFGISYRSKVKHTADGTYRLGSNISSTEASALSSINAALGAMASAIAGNGSSYAITTGGHAALTAPQNVILSGWWKATPKWGVGAMVRWTDWSTFDTLDITNDSAALNKIGMGKTSVKNEWRDSWFFSIGTDYQINDEWTIRGGAAYEKSPVNDRYRLAIIPDSDRIWLTVGATWHVTKNLQGDFGFGFIRAIGNGDLFNEHSGVKEGELDYSNAYMFGAQMVYKF